MIGICLDYSVRGRRLSPMTHQRLAHANRRILSNRLAQLEPVGPEEDNRRALSKVPHLVTLLEGGAARNAMPPLCFNVSGILTKFR
jgi:hypothetical protein